MAAEWGASFARSVRVEIGAWPRLKKFRPLRSGCTAPLTDNVGVAVSRRNSTRQTGRPSPRRRSPRPRARPRWTRAVVGLTTLSLVLVVAGIWMSRSLSAEIDARLAVEWTPAPTQLFATEFDISPGLALDRRDFAGWLDELAYTERDRARGAGEFAVEPDAVTLVERQGPHHGRTVRVRFTRDAAGRDQVSAIAIPPDGKASRISLGTPLLSVRSAAERRKHRIVPLAAIPGRVVQAVLAAEDHRFFDHPGIDPVRIVAAVVTNLTGDLPYLVGASTLTQQLVKNTMLTPGQTVTRKLHEQALSLLLERRLPKSRILELYLNEVYLGQHGSFAIHGVAQGARALFGKDLHNLSLGEAATMAGTIQAPQRNTPVRHPARARTRRNAVLQAMVELDFITPDAAMSAAREPVEPVAALGDVEAPYFADLVGGQLESMLNGQAPGVRVETTLDVRLQRLAEIAVQRGLRDMAGPSAAGTAPVPQIALVAVDPRSGAIRALIGGNSYHGSQFNRAARARRQPGSVIKPFVYLAALERARHDPDFAFTPSSLIDDEPTTFMHDGRPWHPTNFGQTYDGAVTARLALARSRNVAAVKVAERAGLAAVAELWAQASGGTTPPPYPSLALGTFEATPLEVAAAYTMLANGGEWVPLHAVARVSGRDGINVTLPPDPPRQVAGADSAFLVTQMLRSTFEVGTATAARQRGFDLVAAGKTGTTDDLRDAWFAGFTPMLVTVVWVGHDDNRPLGLTGAQAALPIWTDFMRRAHEGRQSADFNQPPGVTRVEVDPVSGLLATARCPAPLLEAFRDGTMPGEWCPLH